MNSLSATSMDLKSNSSSVGSNVYNSTIPIQQSIQTQANIQQQQQQQQQQQASNKPANQFITPNNTSQLNQVPITTVSGSSNQNTSTLTNTTTPANLASRRKLPHVPTRTPETQQQQQQQQLQANNTLTANQINLALQTNIVNQILIQCWVDAERRELVVNCICAQCIRSNPNTLCFGQVRILPNL